MDGDLIMAIFKSISSNITTAETPVMPINIVGRGYVKSSIGILRFTMGSFRTPNIKVLADETLILELTRDNLFCSDLSTDFNSYAFFLDVEFKNSLKIIFDGTYYADSYRVSVPVVLL